MVFNNNYKGTMSLVTIKGKGGILPLNETNKASIEANHPKPATINPEALYTGPVPTSEHFVFYNFEWKHDKETCITYYRRSWNITAGRCPVAQDAHSTQGYL